MISSNWAPLLVTILTRIQLNASAMTAMALSRIVSGCLSSYIKRCRILENLYLPLGPNILDDQFDLGATFSYTVEEVLRRSIFASCPAIWFGCHVHHYLQISTITNLIWRYIIYWILRDLFNSPAMASTIPTSYLTRYYLYETFQHSIYWILRMKKIKKE